MKKTESILFPVLYALGHAALISLGAVCALNAVAIVFNPFGSSGQYPRFWPFCLFVGLTAFLVWIYLIFQNARHLLEHDAHLRWKIAAEVILTILLTLPGMWLWDTLFRWLQLLL